jgi:hypothetical protein
MTTIKDWTENHIKHKNLMKNDLKDLKVQDDIIIAVHNDYEEEFLLREILTDDLLEKIKEGKKTVVCLNVRENVDWLHKNWELLHKNQYLTFIFLNPKTNSKWMVKPHIHEKICDKESLKEGLVSMHENIS